MPHRRVNSSSRARPPGRGFTLIELVAVIVVTAVVGLSAVASMSTTQATRQKLAVRQLARDLSYLRERALAGSTNAWVTFNTTADTYTLLADNPSSPGFSGAVAITDPATGQSFIGRWNTREFAAVDMVSSTSTSFGFDWMGRPVNTSGTQLTGVVTITASGSRTVTIQPQTGLIAWQ